MDEEKQMGKCACCGWQHYISRFIEVFEEHKKYVLKEREEEAERWGEL